MNVVEEGRVTEERLVSLFEKIGIERLSGKNRHSKARWWWSRVPGLEGVDIRWGDVGYCGRSTEEIIREKKTGKEAGVCECCVTYA